MSLIIKGRDNSIKIEPTPDGYRIYPCIPNAPEETKVARKFFFAGQSLDPGKAQSGEGVPSPAFLSLLVTPPPTIVKKADHFSCPIDYSRTKTINYFAIDLGTGEKSLWNEDIINISEELTLPSAKDSRIVYYWNQLLIPEDRKRLAQDNSDMLKTGRLQTTYQIETPPDKPVRKIVVCAQVIYNEEDRPRTVLGINQEKIY